MEKANGNQDKNRIEAIIAGLVILVAVPSLFLCGWNYAICWVSKHDANTLGVFGDIFGGIANPVIGLASAFLIWRTLVAQINANERQMDLLENQEKYAQSETQQRNNFEIARLVIEQTPQISIALDLVSYVPSGTIGVTQKGLNAFSKIFEDISNGKKCEVSSETKMCLDKIAMLAMFLNSQIVKINDEDLKIRVYTAFWGIWNSISPPIDLFLSTNTEREEPPFFVQGIISAHKSILRSISKTPMWDAYTKATKNAKGHA